jgi:hypothetical protein
MVGGHLLTNALTWWNLAELHWDYDAFGELHAYQIRELERYVQLILKVLHHRHRFSVADLEPSISGALPSQSFDKTVSIGVVHTIWGGDLDTRNEILEAQALTIGKPMPRGECIWSSTLTEKIQSQGNEVSGLVHCPRRNVDVYKNLIDRRSHRLKISAPQNYTSTDGSCFLVGKKGPRIGWIPQAGFHTNGDIQCHDRCQNVFVVALFASHEALQNFRVD